MGYVPQVKQRVTQSVNNNVCPVGSGRVSTFKLFLVLQKLQRSKYFFNLI